MAIINKTVLDHIFIQFSYGAEHQKQPVGALEGAHFTEIEYLVDDETGKVIGRTENKLNGMAQPLDPAKVSDVLGKQFSAIEAQLQKAQADTEVASSETENMRQLLSAEKFQAPRSLPKMSGK